MIKENHSKDRVYRTRWTEKVFILFISGGALYYALKDIFENLNSVTEGKIWALLFALFCSVLLFVYAFRQKIIVKSNEIISVGIFMKQTAKIENIRYFTVERHKKGIIGGWGEIMLALYEEKEDKKPCLVVSSLAFPEKTVESIKQIALQNGATEIEAK